MLRLGQQHFARLSAERMRQLATLPDHPVLTAAANQRRRETRTTQRAFELAWERDHPGPVDRGAFARDVAPLPPGVSATAIARATGLSVSYCADIKKGVRVPHPKWWPMLAGVAK